jgi:hypothetical protein
VPAEDLPPAKPMADSGKGTLAMTSVILWTGDQWFKLVPGTGSRERVEDYLNE